MKQLTYISILVFALTSCGTNNSETKDAIAKPRIDSIQIFKSILNGVWYQSSYVDSIQQTKSPFRSRHALAEMVELDIDTTGLKGDSLEIGAPGIHEGTSFVIYFKPGLTSTSLPTNIIDYDMASNFYELSYNVLAGETALTLSVYSKDKKLIGKTQYLKAPKNSEGPLQYMVNKTLFSGNYQATDISGKVALLKFTNDGRVFGLPNYNKYYVLTDFVAESENSVDQVCFDIQTNNQRCYGFTIQADTIKLYDLKESIDTTQFGELKYKLVKQ